MKPTFLQFLKELNVPGQLPDDVKVTVDVNPEELKNPSDRLAAQRAKDKMTKNKQYRRKMIQDKIRQLQKQLQEIK